MSQNKAVAPTIGGLDAVQLSETIENDNSKSLGTILVEQNQTMAQKKPKKQPVLLLAQASMPLVHG